MPRGAGKTHRDHAIVIGGGVAGLLTSHVLTQHYARVTLFDRDLLPDEPVARTGVPQGRHVHVLLTRGDRIFRRYFPGFEDDFRARQAPRVDWARDLKWHLAGGWLRRGPSEVISQNASRPLFEWVIRRHVVGAGKVRFVTGYAVDGLRTDGERVVGVDVRAHGRGERMTLDDEDVRADLVVDASGRGSKAVEWLEALGYGPPEVTEVNAHLGYASRILRHPKPAQFDWKNLYVINRAPLPARSGVITSIEDGLWLVTLVGLNRDYPPTEDAAWLEFARSLASPEIHAALVDATPVTPLHAYRRTANRLRHFNRMRRWPAGFVCTGDAVCTLNPVYGQGMTTAARSAETLEQFLSKRSHRSGLVDEATGLAFQRRLARTCAVPFLLAVAEDFRWPGTEGRRPPGVGLVHRYLDRVIRSAHRRVASTRVLFEVLHMLRSPATVVRPDVLAAALLLGGPPRALSRR
ncbi:MAG: FAD-dependent monooxygenase [Nannocystaceae bacterium]